MKTLRVKGRFFCLIILLLLPQVALAKNSQFAVGIGYPYLLAKYEQAEVKYAAGQGIKVFAGRYYMDVYQHPSMKAFIGAEAGYVKFNTLDIKGKGYEGGLFVGGEYRIIDTVALSLDIAPLYIKLKSEDGFKAAGLEIVTNIAVYYYFSKR